MRSNYQPAPPPPPPPTPRVPPKPSVGMSYGLFRPDQTRPTVRSAVRPAVQWSNRGPELVSCLVQSSRSPAQSSRVPFGRVLYEPPGNRRPHLPSWASFHSTRAGRSRGRGRRRAGRARRCTRRRWSGSRTRGTPAGTSAP